MLDGKALGGRCAGQKSWRGTHVVLLCFLHDEGIVMDKVRGIIASNDATTLPGNDLLKDGLFQGSFPFSDEKMRGLYFFFFRTKKLPRLSEKDHCKPFV